FGGPHNQALLLSSTLAKRGVALTVLLPAQPPNEEGNAIQRLREGGVDVITIPLGRVRATMDPRRQLALLGRLPRDVQGIRRLIRDRGFDMVQVGGLV